MQSFIWKLVEKYLHLFLVFGYKVDHGHSSDTETVHRRFFFPVSVSLGFCRCPAPLGDERQEQDLFLLVGKINESRDHC